MASARRAELSASMAALSRNGRRMKLLVAPTICMVLIIIRLEYTLSLMVLAVRARVRSVRRAASASRM